MNQKLPRFLPSVLARGEFWAMLVSSSGPNVLTGLCHSCISKKVEMIPTEGGIKMRKLVSLLLAFGLLLGVAGSALADCSPDHPTTTTPSPERPPVQT